MELIWLDCGVPGGKLESGETRTQALSRELHEELGIEVIEAEPLIQVRHHYPEREVLLDVWMISQYKGQAFGREQQPLQWELPERLHTFNLHRQITHRKTHCLPDYYVILDADNQSPSALYQQLQDNATNLRSVFLLRSKSLDSENYRRLAVNLIALSRQLHVKLLLNSSVEQVIELEALGCIYPHRRRLF